MSHSLAAHFVQNLEIIRVRYVLHENGNDVALIFYKAFRKVVGNIIQFLYSLFHLAAHFFRNVSAAGHNPRHRCG